MHGRPIEPHDDQSSIETNGSPRDSKNRRHGHPINVHGRPIEPHDDQSSVETNGSSRDSELRRQGSGQTNDLLGLEFNSPLAPWSPHNSVLNYFPEPIAQLGRSMLAMFTRANNKKATPDEEQKLHDLLATPFREWIATYGAPDLFYHPYSEPKEQEINLATLQRISLFIQQKDLANLVKDVRTSGDVSAMRCDLPEALERYGTFYYYIS
jgi:hypothetical protein